LHVKGKNALYWECEYR